MDERARVLLVDDSPLFLKALELSLAEAHDDLVVVGTAENGLEAVEKTVRLKPNVVTMDVLMPSLNGLESIRMIMSRCPTPILVLSSLADGANGAVTLEALRAGAVDVWSKPSSLPPTRDDAIALTRHLKLLSRITVKPKAISGSISEVPMPELSTKSPLIALVASAGGTKTLAGVLGDLPASLKAPVLVVCRPPVAPTQVFASWLQALTPLRVRVAVDGEEPVPGTVLLAPENAHLEMQRSGRLSVTATAPFEGSRPSATLLLESCIAFNARGTIAVVLGGKGYDGVRGLAAVQRAGGIPLVIDPADTEIDETPAAAIREVPQAYVVPLAELPQMLVSLAAGDRF